MDARQARHHLRLPGAAHGRQRARAHLRQPGDVRVQQRADGRLHRHRHAERRDRQRLRQLPARRAERRQRHRGFAGGHERPLPHLRVLGPGRLQGDVASGVEPRPALRHHAAVHRGLRSLVVHEPGPAQHRGRRLPRRHAVRRLRRQQLPVPDADQDLLRQRRSPPRRRLQPERPDGAARLLRHHVLAPRRGRRPRRRPQRHRHARPLGQRLVPEHERLRAGLQLEQRRAGVSEAAVPRSDAQRRLHHRPPVGRRRHLRRSRRSAAGRRATRTGTSARSTRSPRR